MNYILNTDSLFLAEANAVVDSSTLETVTLLDANRDHQPGPWAPIVVPTICSLIVFVVGWILTRYFKKKDERRTRLAYRSLVVDWVKLIEPSEDLFIQSLKDISVSIGESDSMQPEPLSVPQAIPNRLNELPLEKLTDVFMNGKEGDEKRKSNVHFFNIVSGFEFQSQMSERVQSEYERYNGQVMDLCQEWNSVYTQFVDALNNSRFLFAYKPIKNSWDAAFSKNRDSIKVHHDYIMQFTDKADSLKDKVLFSYINRLDLLIQQRKAINAGFSQLFEAMATATQDSYKSMCEGAIFFTSGILNRNNPIR